MARTQTLVQLTEDLVIQLDEEAESQGCSRSALIRKAVADYLERTSEQAKVRRHIEGYRRIPQAEGNVDEWGDLSELAASSARNTMRRLEEEEAAAGFSW